MMKVLLPFFLAAGMFCGLAIAQETLPQTIDPSQVVAAGVTEDGVLTLVVQQMA